MADEKSERGERGTADRPLMVVDARAFQAQQLAEEVEELRASGRRLDQTQPGGYYIGADGTPHNAHGLRLDDDAVKAAAKERNPAERIAELDAERAALVAQLEADAARQAAESQPTTDGASEEAEKAAQRKPPAQKSAQRR